MNEIEKLRDDIKEAKSGVFDNLNIIKEYVEDITVDIIHNQDRYLLKQIKEAVEKMELNIELYANKL